MSKIKTTGKLLPLALLLSLLTCEKVPDYCGANGISELYDPACEFCFGNKAYPLCGNVKYNPLTEACLQAANVVGTRCRDGSAVPRGTPCEGYTLTLAVTPEAVGRIERTPIEKTNFVAGEDLILTAIPTDADYEFAGWAGAHTSKESMTTYKMGGAKTQVAIVAMFKPKGAGKLITEAFPKDAGSVTRAPDKEIYDAGERVTVRAVANSGYAFDGWSGASESKTNPVTITMDESKTLVAIFTPATYTLKAAAYPPEGGTVFVNDRALSGDASIDALTRVILLAQPAEGYVFDSWSGVDGPTGKNPTIIQVTGGGMKITANFKPGNGGPVTMPTHRLTTNANPDEGGTVSRSPDKEIYRFGDEVTVTATAKDGYRFTGWSGDTAGTNWSNAVVAVVAPVVPVRNAMAKASREVPIAPPSRLAITVLMDGNKELTAKFERRETPPVVEGGTNCTSSETCKTTTIGGVTWMAENLNIYTADSWCYENSPDSCAKYGRLYTLDAAMTACPNGWHLPSPTEWSALEGAVGSPAGSKLKSKTGWNSNGNGTDDYGFSALPSGDYYNGNFNGAGNNSAWWFAALADDYCHGGGREIVSYSAELRHFCSAYKGVALPVRCVLGGETPKTYTITFNANGGMVSPTSGTTGANGTLSSLPTPTRSGHAFTGWYTAEGGGSLVTASYVFSGSVTIYARWTANSTTGGTNQCTSSETCKTVTIGNQVWMAENLNVVTEDSWCYDNSPDSCAKYGRLYTWAAAMGINTSYNSTKWNGSDNKHQGICPSGWHLPSLEDWSTLINYVGVSSTAGTKLKSQTGWNIIYGASAGTNELGFSALPGGRHSTVDGFINAGYEGYWWTNTESGSGSAYGRLMSYGGEDVGDSYYNKNVGQSVRCVLGESNSTASQTYTIWTFTDDRDKRQYKAVTINGQKWMAENLNYATPSGSWCYGNKNSNCNTYGRLYDWVTTMGGTSSSSANPSGVQGICPVGWHLPSRSEWDVLLDYAGDGNKLVNWTNDSDTGYYWPEVGTKLKSKNGWNNGKNGIDEFGFSALPGGGWYSVGGFDIGNNSYGYWWTATEGDGSSAYFRYMYYDSDFVGEGKDIKSGGYSVRCVRDD